MAIPGAAAARPGEHPLARPFRLGDGDRGCLLLHGFTGTPAEVRPLGERLAADGWRAVGPLLPGHGTRVEDLAATGWRDWFDAVIAAWDRLGEVARVRTCVGLSMGALLALHLAHVRKEEVAALALLAPALRLRNQRDADHALWLSRLPFLPARLRMLRKPNADGRKSPAYDRVPLRPLASMIRLQQRVRGELPSIRTPALILEGALDLTIDPESGAIIERALGGPVRRRIFASSAHILPEEPDAHEVSSAVLSFFDEITSPPYP